MAFSPLPQVTSPGQNYDANTVQQLPVQVIPDEVMRYIVIYLYLMVCGGIALFRAVNNTVNMIIFHRIGLNDSMSVGLMALSLTDFVVCFISVVDTTFGIWHQLSPNSIYNPSAVQYVFGWWRGALFLCSAWVTTLLTVERCVCVVLPFKVKDIFTRNRSLVIMVIIWVVNIGSHMPIFLTQWLQWESVEGHPGSANVTARRTLVLKFSDNRDQMLVYINVVNGNVLPIPSQALVLICGFWMIYGLKASSRIRTAKALAPSDGEECESKKDSRLSSKERKLIQVVLFLAVILTLTMVPRFIAVYAHQFFDINYTGSYGNLYNLLWSMVSVAGILNSSVNIFVYVTINVKYKENLKRLFCKQ